MVAIRAGSFTLREALEHFDEKYDLSEVLERLKEIAAARQPQCVDPEHQKALRRLVDALEQATDQALYLEIHGVTSHEP